MNELPQLECQAELGRLATHGPDEDAEREDEQSRQCDDGVERVTGIEPAQSAWKEWLGTSTVASALTEAHRRP